MPNPEYPVNPEDPSARLTEQQVGEIRDHLTERNASELALMLEFFEDPPTGAEAQTRLRGTKYETYPTEELDRCFALMATLLRMELEARKGRPAL
ncbi:hypothetical protein HY634_03815 [Candidatus Uhrbacteria bacterium]|nr:hypothetical protein [Candidatus Uhrbacteria bacterium]